MGWEASERSFGKQWGMKIDESVENILLSQFSSISFGVSNQFRIFDIDLEGFNDWL